MTRFAAWPWAPPDPGPFQEQPLLAIGPVWMQEVQHKSALKDVLTKRIYRCANGWGLGARRGGRLHQADETTWEIFTIDPRGLPVPPSLGYVTDEQLERAVAALAAYWLSPATSGPDVSARLAEQLDLFEEAS